MSSFVIAANRLLDGVSVWFQDEQIWVEAIAAAALFDDVTCAEGLAAARVDEVGNVVVDVREVEVDHGSTIRPIAPRERMRALGPVFGLT